MDSYKKKWNIFEIVSIEKLQTTCIESEENIVIWHQVNSYMRLFIIVTLEGIGRQKIST